MNIFLVLDSFMYRRDDLGLINLIISKIISAEYVSEKPVLIGNRSPLQLPPLHPWIFLKGKVRIECSQVHVMLS